VLDPAIHAAAKFSKGLEAISIVASAWMRGSSPRMTKERIVLGGYGIAGVAAVLDIKRDSFTDIFQRFGTLVALAHASRQRQHAGRLATVLFLLQNDRVAHRNLLIGGTLKLR
jgi:hypothetical protein